MGSIPIDPEICTDSDSGKPFIIGHPDSPAPKAFTEIVKKIEHYLEQKKQPMTPLKKITYEEAEK